MPQLGETLRQARVQKGISLKEAEQATRISRQHLDALEEEHFSVLPALIYQRGIVRNYATYLGLDPHKVLAMFEEARGVAPGEDFVAAVKPLNMPSHWAPNFAIIAFLVVMTAIVFAWLYSAYFAPPDAVPTAAEVVYTVTPIKTDPYVLPSGSPSAAASATTALPTATTGATTTTLPTATATTPATKPSGQAPVAQAPTPTPTPIAERPTPTDLPAPTDVPEPTQTPGDQLTIRIVAENDIQLTIVNQDTGETLFAGSLAAGDSTETYSAKRFRVYTSDPASTTIVKDDGSSFHMGDSTFELP